MTYLDNNPERRNLTILSLAIIIFYLAEGKLVGSNLNFTLVNIRFEDKGMLIIIVWSMLFWFLFRYVVTNRHSHGIELKSIGFAVNMDYAPVRKYLLNAQPSLIEEQLGINPCKVYFESNGLWYIQPAKSSRAHLEGIAGYLIIKLFLLKIIFKHRATTIPVLIVMLALMTIEVLHYIRD